MERKRLIFHASNRSTKLVRFVYSILERFLLLILFLITLIRLSHLMFHLLGWSDTHWFEPIFEIIAFTLSKMFIGLMKARLFSCDKNHSSFRSISCSFFKLLLLLYPFWYLLLNSVLFRLDRLGLWSNLNNKEEN